MVETVVMWSLFAAVVVLYIAEKAHAPERKQLKKIIDGDKALHQDNSKDA